MLYYNLISFSLLITFLFSSTFSSFSFGESHFPTIQTAPTSHSGKVSEGKYDVGSLGTQRLRVHGADGEIIGNSSLVLAPRRTYRRDPLNNFEKYDGGWNISERHYWASVGFTAVPLFAIAAVWFVGFGLCLSLICLCHFCCCSSREDYGYSRTAYALSLILLILFTLAAIVGSIVLYIGQGKFHESTTRTLEYVVHTADATVDKLNNVSQFLSTAKQTGVDKVFLPSNVQTDIDQIQTKINSSATSFSNQTVDNSDDIQDLLDSVRVALIVISAVMLLLTFLGFLFSILGMQFLVYIVVIIGWFLVAGTFILCGIFLLLHNVTADTCVAMNQWVQNPRAHTALDDILPCVDNATAQETLLKSKEVTSQLVSVVNQVITNVSNINFSPSFPPFYFNQSGPLVPVLCDPFNSDMTDRACSAGEVDLDNATQVWSNFVCQVSSTGVCVTPGRLTPAFYNQMATAVNVSYGLYHYGPFLVDLQDCDFVRRTFDDIYRDYCPGLRRHSKWIYFGLVMVSTAVMVSLLLWVIYGRERRHRVRTRRLEAGHGLEGDKET